jgi:hypothetical protein
MKYMQLLDCGQLILVSIIGQLVITHHQSSGDIEATLTGKTRAGDFISASDAVNTVGGSCK